MWNLRRLCFGVSAFLFLVVIALGIRTGLFASAWADYVLRAPRLDAPTILDFGTQERGTMAQLVFKVENAGASKLVLDHFASSCACQLIGQSHKDGVFQPERIELAPDESAELVVRLAVQGTPGRDLETTVAFRSNDPNRPQVSIPVLVRKVEGGLLATPRAVDFGRVVVGRQARQIVELRDDAPVPRTVNGVMAAGDSRSFKVRFVPETSPKKAAGETPVLLGRVETVLHGKAPGPVKGELQVFLEERNSPDRIPLVGQVVPLVEASPSVVVLPRASTKGPLFSTECVVQSNDGSALELILVKNTPGIDVAISGVPGKADKKVLRIESKAPLTSAAREDRHLMLHARAGPVSCPVEINVRLEPAPTNCEQTCLVERPSALSNSWS